MNGIRAEKGGSEMPEHRIGAVREHPPQQRHDRAGQHEEHRGGPWIATELGQDADGHGEGDPGSQGMP